MPPRPAEVSAGRRRRRGSGIVLGLVALGMAGTGCGSAPAPRGAVVFRQNCASCHSLTGRESPRKSGGDLVSYRLTRAQLLQFTREMPVRRPLGGAELQAVVNYVLATERRAAPEGRHPEINLPGLRPR